MVHTRLARTRRLATIGLSGALVLSMAACAESQRDQGGDTGGSGQVGGTLVIGAAGAPKNFDPIFNDDGESLRPAEQMYERLVAYKPGTTELAPGLAERWEPSNEGKTWTFTLRKNVTFHDGTPFNAAAVCANFDRWFNMKGAAAQSQMIYYADIFEGFATNEGATGEPVYKNCEARDDSTAVLNLTKSKGAFPAAFGLTSLSISSPTALRQFDADSVTQSGDSFTYSAYANEHPTGTGAFKFESFDKANNLITLVRNDQYWGDKAKVDKLVFKVIPDESARKEELRAGTIDGYDLPNPADYGTLREAGKKVLIRPAFNVLYLGVNQSGNPALKDLRVRQALAYAINREQLVKNIMPEGASVAKVAMPPGLAGYTDQVQEYPYDPAKARDLLAQAGVSNLTLKLYQPIDSRPYMPNPTGVAGAVANDLKQVGINIEIVALPFNGGFKDDVQQSGKHDIHLLGWNGDYGDAGNFLGTFFARQKTEFGFSEPALFAQVAAADATVDPAAHTAAYEQVNKDVMSKYLPAIPLSHAPSAIVLGGNLTGFVPSPLTNERYSTVSKG